jgi:hypothetical protein
MLSTCHESYTSQGFRVAPESNGFVFGSNAATRFNPHFLAVSDFSDSSTTHSCAQLRKLRASHLRLSEASLVQTAPRATINKPRTDTTIHVTGRPRSPIRRPQLDVLTLKAWKVKYPVEFHDLVKNQHYVTQSSVVGELIKKREISRDILTSCSGGKTRPCSSVARQQGGIHLLRALAGKNKTEMKEKFVPPRDMPHRLRTTVATSPAHDVVVSKVFE